MLRRVRKMRIDEKKLRCICINKGIRITELAKKSGVAVSTITRGTRRDVLDTTVIKIIKALDIKAEDIII